MINRDRPGAGYGRSWLAIVLLTTLIVVILATGYFGLAK